VTRIKNVKTIFTSVTLVIFVETGHNLPLFELPEISFLAVVNMLTKLLSLQFGQVIHAFVPLSLSGMIWYRFVKTV